MLPDSLCFALENFRDILSLLVDSSAGNDRSMQRSIPKNMADNDYERKIDECQDWVESSGP